jgi:hypothetical protein
MNVWQDWISVLGELVILTTVGEPAEPVSVPKSMVSQGHRDGVLCDLMGDLGGCLDHRLDHGEVSHGVGRGEPEGGVVGVGKSSDVRSQEVLGIGLPLDNGVTESVSVSVSETVKAMAIGRGMDEGGDGEDSVVDHGRVVDEGGGGGDDPGVTVQDGCVPLDNSVRESESVSVSEAGETVAVGSVGDREGGEAVVDHGRVVDEGSGGGDDPGVTVQYCGVSLPLAVSDVTSVSSVSVSESMVSQGHRDGVLCHLMGDLGGCLHHRLDHGEVSHGVGRSEPEGGVVGVGQSSDVGAQEVLGIGLGRSHGGDSGENH